MDDKDKMLFFRVDHGPNGCKFVNVELIQIKVRSTVSENGATYLLGTFNDHPLRGLMRQALELFELKAEEVRFTTEKLEPITEQSTAVQLGLDDGDTIYVRPRLSE